MKELKFDHRFDNLKLVKITEEEVILTVSYLFRNDSDELMYLTIYDLDIYVNDVMTSSYSGEIERLLKQKESFSIPLQIRFNPKEIPDVKKIGIVVIGIKGGISGTRKGVKTYFPLAFYIPKNVNFDLPKYNDYLQTLQTTEFPTDLGYILFMNEIYNQELEQNLLKHKDRNDKFLQEVNGVELFNWMMDYVENPKYVKSSGLPPIEGVWDGLVNALPRVDGCYNSICARLSKDEIANGDKENIVYCLGILREQKQILDELVTKQ
jgi:hypothetical protein